MLSKVDLKIEKYKKEGKITDFAALVYRATAKIPKARLSSYKLIAKAIGKEGSARAVGRALNANPFAPEVPCHRVIASDGHLRGFASGLKKKAKLLKEEGIELEAEYVLDFKKKLYKP